MANKRKSKSKGLDAQALRTFRSDVAKLKRKGIVSNRVDARSQKATRYMRTKVRKFQDVLSGEAVAVKAKKEFRSKYIEAGIFQERGSFLIVPKKQANQRARIKKGRDLIEITTPLKRGEKVELILPYKATDILQLAHMIRDDRNFDGLKKGDEQFAFYLWGHKSRDAFVNSDELVDHVLRNYQHLFNNANGRAAVKNLSLIKFKGPVGEVPEYDGPAVTGPDKPRFNRYDKSGRNGGRMGSYERNKLRVRAKQKRNLRENETPEQREKRLSEQRARTARNKAEKKRDK